MKELIERYKRLYSGVVYDALKFDLRVNWPFVLDRAVHRLSGPRKPTVGRAFTCYGEVIPPGDAERLDRVRIDMLKAVQPGDVLVIRTGITHADTVAHFGDISALLAQRAGAAGVVVDGYTRDLDSIIGSGFPLYGRGTQPIDAFGQWAITAFGVSDMKLKANDRNWVTVSHGDIVFADGDGVLAMPTHVASEAVERAQERASKEAGINAAIVRGEPAADIYERTNRW